MVNRKSRVVKHIALFLTFGGSLKIWKENGILERELRIYQELYNKHGIFTNIISYGNKEDLIIGKKFKFIKVFTNSLGLHPRIYNLIIPILFYKIFLKIKLIKTNQFYGVHLAKRVSTLFKKPLIIRQGYNYLLHIKKEFGEKSNKFHNALLYEKKYANSGNINIFTSEKIALEYKKNYKIGEKKIHILPNYVCLEDWSPSYKIKKKKNTLIFLGRFTEQKNILNLIKAIKGLDKKIIIIGEGKLKKKICELLKHYKIKYILKNRMTQKKIIPFLRQSDFFILPSLYEGNPKTLMEMMIFKIPVIASKVEGNKEIIIHNKTGLLSETNAKSLRKSIQKFYKLSLKQKKEITTSAFLFAKKQFDISIVAEKEFRIYTTILNNA